VFLVFKRKEFCIKKFYIITAFLFMISGVFSVGAQDLIILRDGNVIEARVAEISPTEIRFRRLNHLDGPVIVISRADVLSIRYANGSVDIMNSVSPTAQERIHSDRHQTGASSPASQTTGTSAVPQLGQPTLLQQALNRMPAIPIVGNNLQFVFGGDTWIAKRNGRDFLAGTFMVEDTNEGAIITLAQTHTYPPRNIPGINWIRTPGPTIVLEYKRGPPASLVFVSRSQGDTTQQVAGGTRIEQGEKISNSSGKSANSRNNWLSFELAYIGLGVRYELMLGPDVSLGASIYYDLILYGNLDINAFFRLYPTGKSFFFGTGFGYCLNLYQDYDWGGFTIIPEMGWKIDVGKVGGFYIMPCISVPLIYFDFGVGLYRILYFGMGFAF